VAAAAAAAKAIIKLFTKNNVSAY